MYRRKSVGGLIFVIVGVATLLLAFVISPSSRATSDESEVAVETSDAAIHLSKIRNISMREAETRIKWQNRAETLNDKLTEELPAADYGGLWIDKKTDRVKIGVLRETRINGSKRTELVQKINSHELAEATDYIEVRRSYNELLKTKELLSDTFVERIGPEGWPMQFGIMPSQNKIEIAIPEDSTKMSDEYKVLLDEFKLKYSDMVIYKTYTEKPTLETECNWWFCNSPLRGGVGLKNSFNGYNGILCTAGFNVVGNSGTRYVVTAGHCHNSSLGNGYATETYNYATKKIGPIHDTLLDNPGTNKLDAMLIEIKEDTYNWDAVGMLLARGGVTSSQNPDPPTYNERYDVTDFGSNGGLEGARVCASGAQSSGTPYGGGSCGAINLVDTDWEACDENNNNCARTYKLTRAYYCSTGGDSGMPIFRPGKAHGIHRGNAGTGSCNGMKYFTGMGPIINGFNGNISIF